MEEKNVKNFKKIILLFIIIILVFILIKIVPIFIGLLTEEGRSGFQENIQNLGLSGAFLIIVLEICKILFVFLPGEPIELLAGACYGAGLGLLLIYIGVIFSNVIIIFLVKKYGRKLVNNIVPEEKRLQIENLINNHPAGSEITLIILYFLPALPKDFITYVASLSPISIKKILLISIIGRFPSVFSSVLSGSRLIYGDVKSVIMVYLVTYIISGIIVYLYKRREKTNE